MKNHLNSKSFALTRPYGLLCSCVRNERTCRCEDNQTISEFAVSICLSSSPQDSEIASHPATVFTRILGPDCSTLLFISLALSRSGPVIIVRYLKNFRSINLPSVLHSVYSTSRPISVSPPPSGGFPPEILGLKRMKIKCDVSLTSVT